MPTEQKVTNRDRIIAALAAVLLGGGSAAGIRYADQPREDLWTGTGAHEILRGKLDKVTAECRSQFKLLVYDLNQHLIRSEGKFQRIEQLEEDVKQINYRLNGGWKK